MDFRSVRKKLPLPRVPVSTRTAGEGQSLAAGTSVTTTDGNKPIEEVVEGDMILSGVGRGATLFFPVAIVMAQPYHGPLLRITTKSQVEFCATPNYICFALSDKDEFKSDSVIISAFDGFLPQNRRSNHRVRLSGFSSESYSSLDQAEEVAKNLAHAQGGVEIERAAGFFDYADYLSFPAVELRFRKVSDLEIGMKVPQITTRTTSDGGVFIESRPSQIARINSEEYEGLVYALDIPEARNFAANGILVHDSTALV